MKNRCANHWLPLIFTALGVLSSLAPARELNSPDARSVLEADIPANGGLAVRLIPTSE